MTACAVTGAGLASTAPDSAIRWRGAEASVPPRKPLVVKPILTYWIPKRREAWSWRPWGGVQTREAVNAEIARITKELEKLAKDSDFPVRIRPLSAVSSVAEVNALTDLASADVALVYAAGGGGDLLARAVERSRWTIFFLRHRSGPVSLWYEIISPRYLRRHFDELKETRVDYDDVVVDSYDDVEVRLRALCGLKNTLATKIVCVGGAGGWGPQGRAAPERAAKYFKLQMINVPYKELGKMITAAMNDKATMERARREAGEYLALPGTSLETQREFVDRAFVLYYIFRDLMAKSGAASITINACMGTIIDLSKTTACLPLELLNDQGFTAFCESDFVVIPSGLLLHFIAARPVFLNDPTYPHHGVVTLAHCTGPRRMNGRDLEPARIMTHFESDYGAAPKVAMRRGQIVTTIDPDFSFEKYLLFRGKIEAAPFMPICRDQIDVSIEGSWTRLRNEMRGFHFMVAYGDWRREVAYALKKIGIATEDITGSTPA